MLREIFEVRNGHTTICNKQVFLVSSDAFSKHNSYIYSYNKNM